MQIEKELAELLQTMEDEQQGAAQAGRPSQGGCPKCNQRNKLISELKIVRMMQERVNRRTVAVDEARVDEARAGAGPQGRSDDLEILSRELKGAIEGTRDREAKVSKITGKLHDLVCPDCVGN